MTGTLVTAGLLFEALLLVAVVLQTFLEQARLSRFLAAATDPERAKEAAKALPEPQRSIAGELADSVRLRSTLDEALVKALVRAAGEPWAPPVFVQGALHVLTVLVALLPLVAALFSTAGEIADGFSALAAQTGAARYLEGPRRLAVPFEQLRAAVAGSAVLLVGLALIWGVGWWLRRPQVREARFIRALLELATRIRPGTSAPVGARLAELVAPERTLERPVAASVVWLLATTAAWGILQLTAEVRAANHQPVRYRVWPADRLAPLGVGVELNLPRERGGRPFEDKALPTVTVGPGQLAVQGQAVAALGGGGRGWPPAEARLPEGFAGKAGVTILAHAPVSANDAVLPALAWLHAQAGVERFHLILERDLGYAAAQAELVLEVPATAPTQPGLTLVVEADHVEVGQAHLPFSRPTWRREAAATIRGIEGLVDTRAPVLVQVGPGVSYGRLMEALGAADDSCDADVDCGLPGLGLRFVLSSASPSR
jgi:hypothetical protein